MVERVRTQGTIRDDLDPSTITTLIGEPALAIRGGNDRS
jgi:hypothetical protein